MKANRKKQPSNVFTIPKWMQNLKAVEPMTELDIQLLLALCIWAYPEGGEIKELSSRLIPKVGKKLKAVLQSLVESADPLDTVHLFLGYESSKGDA